MSRNWRNKIKIDDEEDEK